MLCLLIISLPGHAANHLNGVRLAPNDVGTRVVLDMSAAPDYTYFSLTGPHRLVVDLKGTSIKTDLDKVITRSTLVQKVRSSTPKTKRDSRLVLEMSDRSTPEIFVLKPAARGQPHRLVIDLPHDSKSATPARPAVETPKPVVKKPPSGNRDVVIAIDAGHGGTDPGAIGPNGEYEKDVTLAIARRLAARINAQPGMRGELIRTHDAFVDLRYRSEKARKFRADMLISIHADGFHSPKPSGASVWVLSDRRAKSEMGKMLEDQESLENLLGGAGELLASTNDANVSQTFMDLTKEHSMLAGYDVADRVLGELKKVTHLHKSRPESASLAVLRAPDIPSILVEAGFITNPTEARRLRQSQFQEQIATAITRGVSDYFVMHPPQGSWLANNRKPIRYTVKRGDSLSIVAQRHGVSVNDIRRANNLKSDTIRINQVLMIPAG